MTGRLRGARSVPIDEIRLSGDNMREDVGDIDELSWSIRKHGLLQPVLVTERDDAFLLVCGHRRVAAARRAGLTEVPVVVRDLTEDERLEVMLVENIHRKYLSPLEEGWAFEAMMKQGATQYDVASKIGKSQTYVSFRTKLLECPGEIQQKVHRGEMGLQKAIAVVQTPNVRTTGGRPGSAERWYIYYIDRLIGWFEAGRIPLDDDTVVERLRLLGRALKALTNRDGATRSRGGGITTPRYSHVRGVRDRRGCDRVLQGARRDV